MQNFSLDSGAMHIDAFSIYWYNLKFYAFHPISVISKNIFKNETR